MPESSQTHPFLETFAAQRTALPGARLDWLANLRESGIARFAERGLPSPRLEAWKYTNLGPLEKIDFAPARSDSVSIDHLPTLLPHGQGGHRLVFVDGYFRADLSHVEDLPDGVELGSLSEMLAGDSALLAERLGRVGASDSAEQPLLALNTALMADGFVLRLRRGVRLAAPVEIVFVGATGDKALAYHPRNLIVLEPGSQATILEHHAGLGGGTYLANGGTEVVVGADAALHHYKVQAESDAAFHVSTAQIEIGRNALYDGFLLTTGARLSRNEVTVRLVDEGGDCRLNGAYMLRGEQHCDTTTTIHHEAPHTSCREVFKGVVDDAARGVFQGKIVVHKDAQHTNGHQLSKALLLSDRAEVDTKPELEIYADDVKCSHGATTGDLDRTALFYLRSRGIPESAARHMLIEAFLSETIHAIAAQGLCPALLSSVGHWLSDARTRRAA
jgi:Fe-S cluster assembly protein SufD